VQIILAQDVDKLGLKGDLVSVADGYARNFLVPKGLAITASKGTMKQAELMRRARLDREQRVKEAAAARVATLGAEPVFISARAGDGGRLFGSVTSSDVARAIEEQLDESVDRHDIRLDDPIRSLGTHQVEVRLHAEVNALVNVEVIAHDE